MTIGDKLRTLRDVELALVFKRCFKAAYHLSQKHPNMSERELEITACKVEFYTLKTLKEDANSRDFSFLEYVKEGA